MSNYTIDYVNCGLCGDCIEACPFDAIEEVEGKIEMNAGCQACGLCVEACDDGLIKVIEDDREAVDKDEYSDVMIFAEQVDSEIHPVTFELMGKGKELAAKIEQELHVVLAGHNLAEQAEELLNYGADKVYLYDQEELHHYSVEPYTAVIEDFINQTKPTIILMGATSIGRSLAPRVATRFKTGLTADCTILDVRENTDLVQTRPAFGGNIMARILTTRHRPQMATMRYKVMEPAKRVAEPKGEIIECSLEAEKLATRARIVDITKKPEVESIEDAEVIIAVGRGIREEKDLEMARELADLLGGKIGTTRPLIEKGWTKHQDQIGLSGRTVRPKLIITLGISGAVQFVAGMKNAEHIFAVNTDPDANIFDVAHYGVVGDLYQIVPKLIEDIRNGEGPLQEMAAAN
ncbi:electron transfer flavoprotein subunit alpha [Fuchsiella alkaliacetigena]|uniref:electron transfer flavoprotein subunit alpha n=1 Tax=Fuchsiella alkaliacetigena TaxID=957042 RepID=UPI00200ABAC4|nr:electron transfer flavoprotein subunit alpha [Fuchsiella alkaliacetigena]MCK8824788.1 electron transfer flavoprotein subunit alpha [Fuchsiella alkaliacetigena]